MAQHVRCTFADLKITVLLLLMRLILAASLTSPNCSIRKGTTCVGDPIGTFAQGNNIRDVLNELQDQFCGCTHITGSVQIDLSTMQADPPTLTEDDFNFLYYVEEISGVLRFQNISTVDRIVLPSLVIIRGDEQVPTSEGDRLVLIIRNTEIGELIMPELREISDGDVLFENTGNLCNYKTINWNDILNNGRLVEINACNVLTGALPDCSACDSGNCWSPLHCQTLSKVPCGECELDRCYLAGGTSLQCCNPQCAAACFGSRPDQCFACKDFDNNGTCVSQCPPAILYDPDLFQVVPNPAFRLAAGDLCVEECPEGLFELSGKCLLRCPSDFFSNEERECICCNGPCPTECPGLMLGQNVDSTTFEQFRDCTIVASGGLYISNAPSTATFTSPDDLEVLSTIQEIRGPLEIQAWDQESFPYLRNLRVVGAENSTRNLTCSGVYSDFSLIIALNPVMKEIDLSSLEEIRGGGYVWFNNPQLCFTGNYSNYLVDLGEAQCVSMSTPPRRDGEACIANGFTCHEQCASEFSCWGRNDTQCDGCRNFEYRDRCVQDCSFVELAINSSGLFQNESSMVCENCDQQCLGGCIGGVGPENCIDCRTYFITLMTGRLCVEECPLGTYLIPSTGECAPCFEACVGGCAGPLPYVNVTHGCLQCSRVELDRNGEQVTCLRTACEVRTYSDILDAAIGDLPSESEVCRPCNELCEACIGLGTALTVCPVCTYATRTGEGCVRECDPIEEFFLAADRFCLSCSPACSGCDGPSISDCLQCATNFTKEFFDVDGTSFICREGCPLSDYISPENVCEDCDPLCEQCVGPGPANCTSCRDERFMEVLGPVNTSAGETVLVECFNCVTGQQLVNGICEDVEDTPTPQSQEIQLGAVVGGAVGGVSVIALVVAVLAILVYVVLRRKRKKMMDVSNVLVLNNYHGFSDDEKTMEMKGAQSGTQAVSNSYSQNLESTTAVLTRQKTSSMEYLDELDVYNSMVISKDKIQLLETIGEVLRIPQNLSTKDAIGLGYKRLGEFGVVYKGHLLDCTIKRKKFVVDLVAIKTLKGFFDESHAKNMLDESIKMMSLNHPHILGLIGICVDAGPAPYLVMPFMANGSLLSYLRSNRQSLVLPQDEDEENITEIQKKMMDMCVQIAKGMEYLAGQKFVHRDLAARNCMIDTNFVIKVADFGLSEDVYERNYFRQGQSAVKLPIKWMAVESITDGVFSEKTDVWSFGVTCWEIYSGGKMPYPGVDPMSLVELLEAGRRLDRPKNAACSGKMFSVMTSCWSAELSKRPLFTDLVNTISQLLVPLADYMDFTAVSGTEPEKAKDTLGGCDGDPMQQ